MAVQNMKLDYESLKNLDFAAEDLLLDLFTNEGQVPFMAVNGENRIEVYPIHSGEAYLCIRKAIFQKQGRPPTKQRLDEVLQTLAAKASYEGRQRKVWTRVAVIDNCIEIDLNNKEGRCIKITPAGWEVAPPTNTFYRPLSSQAMITPKEAKDWNVFKKHFNTKSEEDLQLIIGFLLAALRPKGPYPILVIQGEQGSAKSTIARMIKTLVDPAVGSTRGLIRKEHDLFIAAKNNHLLSFDNISLINNDLSDTLCRLATGGSFSARTLYTNDSETLIELCKPVLLNGITDFITRPDLASRSIIVELATIPDDKRKTEAQVQAEFEQDLPLMQGILMNGMVSALANFATTKLEKMPRMADVAIWCTAAEKGLGWEHKTFINAVKNNELNAVLNHLSTDPVAIALRAFLGSVESGQWEGTAGDLLEALNRYRPDSVTPKSWPTTPSYLSQYLTRLAPNLRHIGLDFIGRNRSSTQRTLVIQKLSNFTSMNSANAKGEPKMPPAWTTMFDHDDSWTRPNDGNDGNDAVVLMS